MKSIKKKAYSKLLKYIKHKYSGQNVKWFPDIEDEESYTMRASLPNGQNNHISINYETMEIKVIEIDTN